MRLTLLKTILTTLILSCLFTMDANAQNPVKNYDKEWKKVDDFVQKGLPKSALEEVKKIYTQARADKQDAQVIKAVIQMISLQEENRENSDVLSIAEIEKEIANSKEPVTSLLKSFTASLYWNYFQRNRWKLYNRTKTENFKKEDIATWDAEDFHHRIGDLFQQSIREEKLLQQVPLAPYDAIIIKGNMRHLRPTLYDLLAHRALSYFENSERDIKKPAYAFELDQPTVFDPAAEFIKHKYPTRDTFSLLHEALLIYQRLLALHLNDTKPDALIDLDLKRLEFVKSHSTHPDKDNLYFNALNRIASQYGNLPAAAQAWFLMAAAWNEKADLYKPHGDTTQRYARIKARDILNRILQQKDSSEGKINAYNLLATINTPWFEFNLEKVNLPAQPFRALVEYKNVEGLYFRIIRADETIKKLLETAYDEKYWTGLAAASAVRAWQQPLPVTNDLQQHAVEIKIDPLSTGDYVLLASSDKNFTSAKTILGARFFHVSSISYVNNDDDFYVLNRDNGQPLAKAEVQVWQQRYDYKQSKYIREKGKSYTTDEHGYFKMVRPKKEPNDYASYNYLLDISYQQDRLFMTDYTYDYYYSNNTNADPKNATSIFLFTDRSLYRPGQTVFVKGIVLLRQFNERQTTARENYTTTLYLRDANYKDVDTIQVRTNAYGSFQAKFTLPTSGLNGLFSIYTKTDNGNATFRMEEYKRPKFFVDFEPIQGTYKVNDKITVTGVAKGYAGNMIDGASVKYRVVRQPRFLYYWMFYRWWQPPTESLEITHGEVQTDKDGKYTITFTAIPDLKLDKKFEPVFDYKIYVDVTDINGETRSGQQQVTAGYRAIQLVTTVPATVTADSLRKLYIRTQNMNGAYVPAKVKVTISKLQEEKRLIRERYWDRPDQFIMSKAEYIRNFPYDEYDNENDFKTWEKTKVALEKSDSTAENGDWLLSSKLQPGFYEIEIVTIDKDGQPVKDIKYVQVLDEKNAGLPRPVYLWTGNTKTTVEPGETATIEIGSGADNVFAIQRVDRLSTTGATKNSSYSYLTLDRSRQTLRFPVTEADRGGFGVSLAFVKHNRYYQVSQSINVPWSNKELAIEYASFRDKTLPGSEEKWTLTVRGHQQEKVAAEMLASMYDASLDQYYPHGWNIPNVWPAYYDIRSWNGTENFASIVSIQKSPVGPQWKQLDKRYDYLFNEDYGGPMGGGYNGNFLTNRVAGLAVVDSAPKSVKEQSRKKDEDKDGVADQMDVPPPPPANNDNEAVTIRKNFNETAFFYPDLHTDSTGAITFSFTLPDALTRWKFMALAHTKDAAFGSSTREIVTQKDLMVQPNAPRFLREGDKIEFSAKIVNLTDKELTGTAQFQLFDAATNEPVDGWFRNMIPNQYFTVAAGRSEAVRFPIEVPYQFNKALTWRIVAISGAFSDGEENALPVLTNRMLVTETMSLPVRGTGTKNFTFDKLLNAGTSNTLQHQSLTVEFTSNRAWYAVQALPYLMEYPYDCSEQTWNRYYANSLATHIANASPRIREIFERWKINDTTALLSNLQKNQELKAVLLEETPWVLAAKNEAEQKRNIALLFDLVQMSKNLNNAYDKLKQMQSSNGGFVWFSGGPDDRYITQYIATGIGHLKKLNSVAAGEDSKLKAILTAAIPYLDRKLKEDYDYLLKNKADLKQQQIGAMQIQYLYMRSFFPEYKIDAATQIAYNYYFEQAKKYWVSQSVYMKGMLALALYRSQETTTAAAILKSLKETAINNDELGMYWKDASNGWFWYQAPYERQALLIEAFLEAGKDTKTADDLRVWLLKNKQTNNWRTTKATAEVCYALLLQGTDWLTNEPNVTIQLGNTRINSADQKQEAGTGYFKTVIDRAKVDPQMGKIAVTVTNKGDQQVTSWGGVYWQYFEDLDKITNGITQLSLTKKLFIEKNTDRGPVLTPVNDGDIIMVGDKIRVRIELRTDRDMEYVHMKDMRASSLEPVNVLSGYRYQGGLGYYESTKDASTNFFFNQLRKGTYVFEYSLFANQAGNFSNGITTLQCMYAPEFSSHSEGIRINVENR